MKSECPPLADNRTDSLKNFMGLERRLQNRLHRYDDYSLFMKEYLEQGHMKIATVKSPYVIPQHVVFKEASTSTKLRTVFNASSPDSTGWSLNDRLLPGPKLQLDISDVLLNFRFHRYALTADLRQMYRQILIREEDQVKQHIFWRPTTDSKIAEYQLCTVTYGMTPSAYLAQRVLLRLVEDEGAKFPLASKAILQEKYMDDFLTGAETREGALLLYQELNSLLSLGCFELRKWSSNDSALLLRISQEHREVPLVFTDNSHAIKLLGIYWNSAKDAFMYEVQEFQGTPTKRSVLSYLARTFDPLGFISPITFWMKRFIQTLWTQELDWNTALVGSILSEWLSFSEQLSLLKSFQVPRFVLSFQDGCELFGFCDASERGYAACLYLVSKSGKGKVSSSLIKSKSKVAPLKVLSIPRLELQGALLLSRIADQFCKKYPGLCQARHLFTDSQIVLAWLRLGPYQLNTFVANRVSAIQELTSSEMWFHVESSQNPADAPSRGMGAAKFLNLTNWLEGPSFLANWTPSAQSPVENRLEAEVPELKSSVTLMVNKFESEL